MMKIFIYANEESKCESLSYRSIATYLNKYEFSISNDLEYAKKSTKESNYDLFIVDDEIKNHNILIEYLLGEFAKQNTLLITSNLRECYDKSDCNRCMDDYKLRRLIKPTDSFELIEIIKSFSATRCKYHEKISKPTEILEDVLKRFLYFDYEMSAKKIIPKVKTSNSLLMGELLEIVDFLDENSIKYSIIHDHSIKLF